jgi:hypothetical protein
MSPGIKRSEKPDRVIAIPKRGQSCRRCHSSRSTLPPCWQTVTVSPGIAKNSKGKLVCPPCSLQRSIIDRQCIRDKPMYTVASHHPRNCRLLLFFGLKRAILVGVDTVEHPSHEVQELVFGHHAIWSLSVMRGCGLPSLCAVTAVYSLMRGLQSILRRRRTTSRSRQWPCEVIKGFPLPFAG